MSSRSRSPAIPCPVSSGGSSLGSLTPSCCSRRCPCPRRWSRSTASRARSACATIELPFLIWLMKNFFDNVPRYLEEAAWLDGRSKLRALAEIVLPVARNGIGVVAGLSFLAAWAEVLMMIILIDSQDLKTVPLAFYETLRTQGGYTEVQYGLVAAMGVLYAVPVMIIFLATRRMMVRGLIASSRGL
ncbi:MAG: carbohydrate ABC transporter permease [Chloroflexi bacterium]|nr:MAG: carbohydrate ABC transporter permease [Chloroflexota bacterium]